MILHAVLLPHRRQGPLPHPASSSYDTAKGLARHETRCATRTRMNSPGGIANNSLRCFRKRAFRYSPRSLCNAGRACKTQNEIARGSTPHSYRRDKEVRMMRRMVGLSVVVTGCALLFAGGMASAEDLPPLAPVPPEYADKTNAGRWMDRCQSH